MEVLIEFKLMAFGKIREEEMASILVYYMYTVLRALKGERVRLEYGQSGWPLG